MKKQGRNGIWYYADLLPDVPSQYRLTLNEGHTSLKNLDNIFFKCEYENPTGSHKDRAMAYQVSKLYEEGVKKAVISSSGNAAISAAHYCHLGKIDLTVFVSPKINSQKLENLKRFPCRLIQTLKPTSAAFQYAQKYHLHNLKQSTDPNAPIGYMTLAYELMEENKIIDAIFLPVSGGAALVGLARGYQKLKKIQTPAIHAVQTQAIHPIASRFDDHFETGKTSIADAIVAKYSALQEEVIKCIKNTGGFGWVVSDEEILQASQWLKSYQIDCSYEGAAALAAFWKARRNGFNYRYPVCILTGKNYLKSRTHNTCHPPACLARRSLGEVGTGGSSS